MTHNFSFGAFDHILRDIMRFFTRNSANKPLNGKTVVLGGYFHQIIPIIPRASREDVEFTSINSSKLWSHCKVLILIKNTRLQTTNSS